MKKYLSGLFVFQFFFISNVYSQTNVPLSCLEANPRDTNVSKSCVIGSISVRYGNAGENKDLPTLFKCVSSPIGGTYFSERESVHFSDLLKVLKENKDNSVIKDALKAIGTSYDNTIKFLEDPKTKDAPFIKFYSEKKEDDLPLKKFAELFNQKNHYCGSIKSLEKELNDEIAKKLTKVPITLENLKNYSNYNQDNSDLFESSCKKNPSQELKRVKAVEFKFEDGKTNKFFPMNMVKDINKEGPDTEWFIDLKSGTEIISRKIVKKSSGRYVYIGKDNKEYYVEINEIDPTTVNWGLPMGWSPRNSSSCYSFQGSKESLGDTLKSEDAKSKASD